MTTKEILKLSHREFSINKTRSITTIITVGILFAFVLAAILILQGLENVFLQYAGHETDNEIYLSSDFATMDDNLIRERIYKYNGEIVTLTPEQEKKLDVKIPNNAVIAKFRNLNDAIEYLAKNDTTTLRYSSEKYKVEELITDQIATYQKFRDINNKFINPSIVILVVISSFILAFTMAHIISSDTKIFAFYRSLGASKKQILAIYFSYLMKICLFAALFAIITSFIIAWAITGLGWEYFSKHLTSIYANAPYFPPILVAMSQRYFNVLLCIFVFAPVSFLACLDQFSNKKIMQKMKGD